jgi:hypothetical protein
MRVVFEQRLCPKQSRMVIPERQSAGRCNLL